MDPSFTVTLLPIFRITEHMISELAFPVIARTVAGIVAGIPVNGRHLVEALEKSAPHDESKETSSK